MKRISVLMLSLVVAFAMAIPLAGCSSSEYKPEAKDQTVSDSALNTDGTLRVGVNASHAPYATESSGSIVGIEVDIAAALADEMGLQLELVDVGTSIDDAFTSEKVDIVMGVDESGDYWMSDAYLSSSVALFATDQAAQAPTQSGDFKVAAQSSSMSAWEVSDHYGDDCLTDAGTIQEAFEQLASGSVDYVAADSIIGEYVAHSTGTEAYPVALLQDPANYSIACASTNTDLQNGISEALANITSGGIVTVIEKRWLGAQESISSLSIIKAPEKEADNSEEEGDDTSSDESDSESEDTEASTTNTTSTDETPAVPITTSTTASAA